MTEVHIFLSRFSAKNVAGEPQRVFVVVAFPGATHGSFDHACIVWSGRYKLELERVDQWEERDKFGPKRKRQQDRRWLVSFFFSFSL